MTELTAAAQAWAAAAVMWLASLTPWILLPTLLKLTYEPSLSLLKYILSSNFSLRKQTLLLSSTRKWESIVNSGVIRQICQFFTKFCPCWQLMKNQVSFYILTFIKMIKNVLISCYLEGYVLGIKALSTVATWFPGFESLELTVRQPDRFTLSR